MDNSMEPFDMHSDELASDILQFVEIFEQLSPESKSSMIELLHQIKDEE